MKLYNYRTGELLHFGVPEMRWGRRRYQYEDGTYTPLGREHYGIGEARRKNKSTIDSERNERLGKLANKLTDKQLRGESLTKEKKKKLQAIIDEDLNPSGKSIDSILGNNVALKNTKEDYENFVKKVNNTSTENPHVDRAAHEFGATYTDLAKDKEMLNKVMKKAYEYKLEADAESEKKSVRQEKQRQHYHDSWSNFEAKKKNWNERPEDKITEKHSSELKKRFDSAEVFVAKEQAKYNANLAKKAERNYQDAMKRLNPFKTKKLREELQEAMKDARESNKNYQDVVMDVASEYINNNMPKAQRDAARAYVWVYLGNDW